MNYFSIVHMYFFNYVLFLCFVRAFSSYVSDEIRNAREQLECCEKKYQIKPTDSGGKTNSRLDCLYFLFFYFL
jgi:hypothetical protein